MVVFHASSHDISEDHAKKASVFIEALQNFGGCLSAIHCDPNCPISQWIIEAVANGRGPVKLGDLSRGLGGAFPGFDTGKPTADERLSQRGWCAAAGSLVSDSLGPEL